MNFLEPIATILAFFFVPLCLCEMPQMIRAI
jgi:hypothetical protein